MSDSVNIILIGPMGSGKTTLGRRLAKTLGYQFYDCDEEIEKHTGASVNLIFDIEGEAGFRKRETEMLKELGRKNQAVIATGGGAILSSENREIIKSSGKVIWLKASVNQQIQRLESDRKRPLLQAENRRKRLDELAAIRDPLYAGTADIEFISKHRSVRSVAGALGRMVTAYLQETGEPAPHENH